MTHYTTKSARYSPDTFKSFQKLPRFNLTQSALIGLDFPYQVVMPRGLKNRDAFITYK